MSKSDRIIILVVILCAAFLACVSWLFSDQGNAQKAEITVDNTIIALIPLDHAESSIIDGPYCPVTIESAPGKVRVVNTTCPDQTCLKTGWINRTGQVIVCVPNHLVIKITGGDDAVDGIGY